MNWFNLACYYAGFGHRGFQVLAIGGQRVRVVAGISRIPVGALFARMFHPGEKRTDGAPATLLLLCLKS